MEKPENDDNYDFEDGVGKDDDDMDGSIFRKKKVYYYQDLIDYYEKSRFTMPFMVYRVIDWWPIFDIFATYGHVLSNGIIVYIAVNLSVNFYMTLNILCICSFYGLITSRIHLRASENVKRSGLQS